MMMMIIATAMMTTAPRVGQLPAWPMLLPNNIHSTDTELQVTGGYSLLSLWYDNNTDDVVVFICVAIIPQR